MLWIKHHKSENIPEELYYTGYQTDKDEYGYTPLMLWVENCHDKNIPRQLYYNNWQVDENKRGFNPMRIWLEANVKGIPTSILEGY